MIFKNISLRNKLVILMMGISLLLIVLIIGFFSFHEYTKQRDFLINEIDMQTKLLSDFLITPLEFSDTLEAKRALSKMRHNEQIAQITVYDTSFNLLASYKAGAEKSEVYQISKHSINHVYDDADFYAFTRPIYNNSLLIGYIHIGINKSQYKDNLYNYGINTLMLLVIVILVAYAATFILQKVISKPIEKLINQLINIDFNSPASLRPLDSLNSKDEFNQLYESYNQMITKLVQDYNDIENAKDELITANEVKTKILQNMSHELRTPLNGLIGNAAFLLMSDLETDDAELVKMIYKSGKRLLITVESLISLSQFENQEVELALSRYNLGEYIQEYYSKIDILNNNNNLDIKYTLVDRSALAYIDPEYFSQALYQLLDNAVKFTENGYIDIQVDSVDTENGKKALVSIIDTGIGIESQNIESMFDIFKQASEGLNRKYEGIGIGLTLARKIVRMHKGDIEVSSEPGKGSKFTIVLPFADIINTIDKNTQ